MAQKGVQLDQETISCSICLDLLKDPVTVPCGHSYCVSCIEAHWEREDEEEVYSCPQCRKTFTPRPVLGKNTMLAALVEELKKTGIQAAPADHCFAGPEDVPCDFCTGRKRKASNSCLQCLASYCKEHLQPHYEVAPLKKHKLVEPSKKLLENVCSRHDEVMKMFCRTDQQSICYLCSVDEHRGHDTVSAAAERTERQKDLENSLLHIQLKIQDREKDVELLQQEVEAINGSADEVVELSEKMFTELIRLMEVRRSLIKEKVRSQQRTEVSRVKELQEKLEQEISELKRKDAELQKLSHTQDDNRFLKDYPSLSALSESTHSTSIESRPLKYFEETTEAMLEVKGNLHAAMRDGWKNISHSLMEVDGLQRQPKPEPYPKTRADFLKYSRDFILDPNTAHSHILLSKKDRKATLMNKKQYYTYHPDRFMDYWQVMSRESLTGRCYWEVKWKGGIHIAVSYKDICRAESSVDCVFGQNDQSWALDYDGKSCSFWHRQVSRTVTDPQAHRIGVFLDLSAGILSFYSIPGAMNLLTRFHTNFTQPLYAGIGLHYPGDTAEICTPK